MDTAARRSIRAFAAGEFAVANLKHCGGKRRGGDMRVERRGGRGEKDVKRKAGEEESESRGEGRRRQKKGRKRAQGGAWTGAAALCHLPPVLPLRNTHYPSHSTSRLDQLNCAQKAKAPNRCQQATSCLARTEKCRGRRALRCRTPLLQSSWRCQEHLRPSAPSGGPPRQWPRALKRSRACRCFCKGRKSPPAGRWWYWWG